MGWSVRGGVSVCAWDHSGPELLTSFCALTCSPHTHIYTHAQHTHIHTYVCTTTHTHIYTHTPHTHPNITPTPTHAHTHPPTHIHTHPHPHMPTHTHTHLYTYTPECPQSLLYMRIFYTVYIYTYVYPWYVHLHAYVHDKGFRLILCFYADIPVWRKPDVTSGISAKLILSCTHAWLVEQYSLHWLDDLNMWVDYRGSLSTVYNDGEISTCG